MQRSLFLFLAAGLGFAGVAQAATVPFTVALSSDALFFGVPSQSTLALPTTTTGSGTFAPFGTASYTEAGTVTFMMLPSGDFVPASVLNNFSAIFNNGADTFSGVDATVFGPPNAMGLPTFVSTATIQGGTGRFAGATGNFTANGFSVRPSGPATAGQPTIITSSGSGQITAPGLTAVPEPSAIALMGVAFSGLSLAGVVRRQIKAGRPAYPTTD